MKTNLLNVSGVSVLSKGAQSQITGKAKGPVDLSLCGCNCAGNVIGPSYCGAHILCTLEYTCEETS